MEKSMTPEIAVAIRPIFGDFYNGTCGYTHYKGALNCNTCWKFACKALLVLNSNFQPLVSQLELPEEFNTLKDAIEKAPYSYEIKVVTNETQFGIPSNLDKKKNITYDHLSIKIAPSTSRQVASNYLTSIQKWLDNVLALESIASDLRQLETWSDSWDFFEEKLKNLPTLNFFNWIRAFQKDVAKNDKPYIATVMEHLFRAISLTRDTCSKNGWLLKLPVWDQLRNTFMRAVIEATKETNNSSDLKIISEQAVKLLQVWLHPTNLHKHSTSEDGTVTAKTAKRMEQVIEEFGLDKITGSHTTLSQAFESSGLALDFRNLKKNGNNGLLHALNAKKVTNMKATAFNPWKGGLRSIGENISGSSTDPTLKQSMTLQQFADTMKVLVGQGLVSCVEIDVTSKPPPAIMGNITSGADHARFFKNPELMSTCWTNLGNRVNTLDYHGMRNLCVNNRLPVAGMCTNNGHNLHFAISGASPSIKCGIPSWRDHIHHEWFQIIDQSKVGDFINQNVMLSTPEGEQLVCGILESYNPKTCDFYCKPVLHVTYTNGQTCKVTLSGGKYTDQVWNKPESERL